MKLRLALRTGSKAALVAGLLCLGTSAGADVLVVSSSGQASQEYPRYTRLSNNTVLVLRSGDEVRILTSSGTRRYRGPGRFSVASRATRQTSLAIVSGNLARTGISRTPSSERDQKLFDIGSRTAGNFCFLPDQNLMLWRESAGDAVSIDISRLADGDTVRVDFAESAVRTSWPAALTIVDGGRYSVSSPDSGASSELHFMRVEPSDDIIALAEMFIERGCDDQVNLLTELASDLSAGPEADENR